MVDEATKWRQGVATGVSRWLCSRVPSSPERGDSVWISRALKSVAPSGAGSIALQEPWAYTHGYGLSSLRDWEMRGPFTTGLRTVATSFRPRGTAGGFVQSKAG